jgi:hypothetical protein
MSTCPDQAGSLNNPNNTDNISTINGTTVTKYVPTDVCIGEDDLTATGDSALQESYAAENLNLSGAPLNVFKLLGVHEQGKLVDVTGNGTPLNGSGEVFNDDATSWVSPQVGLAVLQSAWIGYDFGTIKTSYGHEAYAPGEPFLQPVSSLKICQPTDNRRALQVRIDSSDGGFSAGTPTITGSGTIAIQFTAGPESKSGTFMLSFTSATTFQVYFVGQSTALVGLGALGARVNSMFGSFTPTGSGFNPGDLVSFPIELDWKRVDVVNLPNDSNVNFVRFRDSAPRRFWRIVPLSFSGVSTNDPWEVQSLELFDYKQTRLDDIQDQLFMENRDRDYDKKAVQIKIAYSTFDAISDLTKFGFTISDTYNMTTTFTTMVKALGRPLVVGDVLELPSEVQYDHNLKPIRKFLEVTDTSWAADGFTTEWKPVIFRFQASKLIVGQEHRDLFGSVLTQKYTVDDGSFFDGIEMLNTGDLTATEVNAAEAQMASPEKGANNREIASGTNHFRTPGSYDGVDLYVEDGLPPDGQPYTEGFKLPDVATAVDGAFFRLNYDPALNIPSRLYQYRADKAHWLYVETDRRGQNNSLRPSQQLIMGMQPVPLNSKDLG